MTFKTTKKAFNALNFYHKTCALYHSLNAKNPSSQTRALMRSEAFNEIMDRLEGSCRPEYNFPIAIIHNGEVVVCKAILEAFTKEYGANNWFHVYSTQKNEIVGVYRDIQDVADKIRCWQSDVVTYLQDPKRVVFMGHIIAWGPQDARFEDLTTRRVSNRINRLYGVYDYKGELLEVVRDDKDAWLKGYSADDAYRRRRYTGKQYTNGYILKPYDGKSPLAAKIDTSEIRANILQLKPERLSLYSDPANMEWRVRDCIRTRTVRIMKLENVSSDDLHYSCFEGRPVNGNWYRVI